MEIQDIKRLAEMARLDMTEEEMQSIAHDFDGILNYVDQVKQATGLAEEDVRFSFTNVMREDVVENEAGFYTDKILAQFPDQADGYLKVKQIL